MSSNSNKPEWYQRALDTSSEEQTITVDNCKINYATWGDVGKQGLVLIHGSNANLEWWRFIAPFLADQFRVAAIDLSGNGNSGWREKYTGEQFAKEVMAVCDAAQLGSKPYVVAHSFGGFVGLETGHYFGQDLGGIIFGDFTVQPTDNYIEWGLQAEQRDGQVARSTKVYDNYQTALGRFRLVPEQPCQHAFIVDYLANKALREVEGGWTWKFDPGLFDFIEMGKAQSDKFIQLKCRSALLLGEHSTDEGAQSAQYMFEITNGSLPIVTIPSTYHHFMFDEPMATVVAIKGILHTWTQSDLIHQ